MARVRSSTRSAAAERNPRQLTLYTSFEALRDGLIAGADPRRPARGLFYVVLALIGLGFLLQVSHLATTAPPSELGAQITKLCGYRLLALGGLLLAARVGPRRLEPLIPAMMGATIILLLLVWVPGVSYARNGSHRWLSFPIRWQPSELARVVAVLWAARRCVQLGPHVSDAWRGALPLLAFGLFLFLLIVVEPDFGGAMLLLLSYCATMWVGGVQWKHVSGGLLLIIGPALLLGATFVGYIRERLSIFLGDSTNEQVSSAFDAIASGGWFGAGFTQGTFRTAGLQYQQSDYVFSLVGEEFGLVGMLIVVGLFGALLVYTLRLVGSLSDRFSSLVAFGLLITVVFQAMLHMQVVTGLAPPKGMILPFLSEGGTALVSSCLAVGLALGAAREEQGGHAP